MKKNKFKKLLIGSALTISSLTPLLTASCYLTVPKSFLAKRDFAINFPIIKKVPYWKAANLEANKGQKAISDTIQNHSIYLKYDQHFFGLNWKPAPPNLSVLTEDITNYSQILDVMNYYFKDTPLNFFALKNYKKFFEYDSAFDKYNYKSVQIAYPTYDSIYIYFEKMYSDAFNLKEQEISKNQKISFNDRFLNLLNVALKNGLAVNMTSENGMQTAMPPIFLPQQLNEIFVDNKNIAVPFRKPLEIGSEKWYEFLQNPKGFLKNPANEEYSNLIYWQQQPNSEEIVNDIKYTTKKWINNYGSQPQHVLKLLAYIMYYNGVRNIEIGIAYSKVQKNLVYYLQRKTDDGKVEYYDFMKIYDLYAQNKNAEGFNGLTLNDIKPYDQSIFENDWTYKPTLQYKGQELNFGDANYDEAYKSPVIVYSDEVKNANQRTHKDKGLAYDFTNDATTIDLLSLLEKYTFNK